MQSIRIRGWEERVFESFFVAGVVGGHLDLNRIIPDVMLSGNQGLKGKAAFDSGEGVAIFVSGPVRVDGRVVAGEHSEDGG